MPSSQASAASSARGSPRAGPTQPSEATDSYFPKGATASTLSRTTSSSETPFSTGSHSLDYPLSPLDRKYSKPEKELDIAEQLAKQPTYWSVKGWVQRSARAMNRSITEDPETRARKFQEAKKDLLASFGRF
ncbi:hypothetical protein F5Y17DRAFT_404468 [Xylariaceae sp. FL0594]|nr:hypothetical protein F5Y17DRAFT_404468 [Xylariaceae sp. FL0594]